MTVVRVNFNAKSMNFLIHLRTFLLSPCRARQLLKTKVTTSGCWVKDRTFSVPSSCERKRFLLLDSCHRITAICYEGSLNRVNCEHLRTVISRTNNTLMEIVSREWTWCRCDDRCARSLCPTWIVCSACENRGLTENRRSEEQEKCQNQRCKWIGNFYFHQNQTVDWIYDVNWRFFNMLITRSVDWFICAPFNWQQKHTTTLSSPLPWSSLQSFLVSSSSREYLFFFAIELVARRFTARSETTFRARFSLLCWLGPVVPCVVI